jgi:hypothetical protein
MSALDACLNFILMNCSLGRHNNYDFIHGDALKYGERNKLKMTRIVADRAIFQTLRFILSPL